ncbi:MAG TPA: hypothetical protein DCY81_08005 [Lachnospiraceae bacterium]|nr:hypothetical protein [Lachnospiraceae bacterium]
MVCPSCRALLLQAAGSSAF